MWEKIKMLWSACTGDIAGLCAGGVDIFNKKVLSKIQNKEDAKPYVKDLESFSDFCTSVLDNHASKMSEATVMAMKNVIVHVKKLASYLEDFNIDEDETKDLVVMVKDAIRAYKRS